MTKQIFILDVSMDGRAVKWFAIAKDLHDAISHIRTHCKARATIHPIHGPLSEKELAGFLPTS